MRSALLSLVSIFVACGGEEHHAAPPATEPIETAAAAPVSVPPPAETIAPPVAGPTSSAAPTPMVEASFQKKWIAAPLAKPLFEDKSQHADTCADLPKIKPPKVAADVQPFAYAKLNCASWKLYEGGKDAKRSFVRNLALDEKALAILPSELGQTVNVKQISGKTWAAAAPKAVAKAEGAILRVDDGDVTYTVSLVAFADVDGDGTEEAIFQVIGGPKQGSAFTMRIFALGKKAEQAPLKVERSLVP